MWSLFRFCLYSRTSHFISFKKSCNSGYFALFEPLEFVNYIYNFSPVLWFFVIRATYFKVFRKHLPRYHWFFVCLSCFFCFEVWKCFIGGVYFCHNVYNVTIRLKFSTTFLHFLCSDECYAGGIVYNTLWLHFNKTDTFLNENSVGMKTLNENSAEKCNDVMNRLIQKNGSLFGRLPHRFYFLAFQK